MDPFNQMTGMYYRPISIDGQGTASGNNDEDSEANGGRWRTALFDCSKIFFSTCISSILCPALVNFVMLNRVDPNASWLLAPPFFTTLYASLILMIVYFIVDGVPLIVAVAFYVAASFYMARARILVRYHYSIRGSAIEDMIIAFWCPCCTLSQMARQVLGNRGFFGGSAIVHSAERGRAHRAVEV